MKNRFKSISLILTVLTFILISNSVNAQQRPPEPPPIPDSTQINDMVAHMTSELGLSKDQSEKVKALYFNHFNKMKTVLEKEKKQRDAIRQEHESLRKDFEQQLEKELTKEQFEKHKQKMEEMRRRDDHHPPR